MPIPLAVAFATVFLPWFKEVHNSYPGTPNVTKYIVGYQRLSGIIIISLVALIMIIQLFRNKLVQNKINEVISFFIWSGILICCAEIINTTFFNLGSIIVPDFGIIICIFLFITAHMLNKKR